MRVRAATRRTLVATTLFVALLVACSRATEEHFVYAPYEGTAYPSQRPALPQIAGEMGLVTNSGSDTISVIDIEKSAVVATVLVGVNPVDIDGPHHIALDRLNGVAYVALSYPTQVNAAGPHASHGSSARPGLLQKLALLDLAPVGEARLEANPGDVVSSDDGKRIVVTHYDLLRATKAGLRPEDRAASLLAFSPASVSAPGSAGGSDVDPVRIPVCVAPHGVTLSRPDGRYAFVACSGDDTLTVVDLEAPSDAPMHVPVGDSPATPPAPPKFGPYAAVLSPDGARVAIACTESKDVRFLDTRSRAMDPLVLPARGAAFFPAWSMDGSKIFVPSQTPDALSVFDAMTGAALALREFTKAECDKPHEAVFGRDPAHVYVVCEGDRVSPSHILKLDATTLGTVAEIPVGVFPDRLVLGAKP